MDFRGGLREIIEGAVVTVFELAFNGFAIIRHRDRPNKAGEIGRRIGPRVQWAAMAGEKRKMQKGNAAC
jgi:hypothetical protein